MIVRKLSDNTKQYVDNYFQIIDDMSKNMEQVAATDSISQMFIQQMIPHHEAAVLMSQNILNFTTDTDIEALAKNIIDEQSKHINQMQNMLEACSACKNCERDVALYQRTFMQILQNMMNAMNNTPVGNHLNVAFLSEMIPHHEGAIQMSKNVLQFEICPQLKELSEKTIVSQTTQLQQMKKLLRMKQ